MTTLRHLVPRTIRLAASDFLARRRSSSLQADLDAMVARSAPIVAGPWLGEVGFELLYWVPFLRWCAEWLDVDPDRFVVMSRGGTASWYRPFAARYVDVFDQVSAETFRDQHDERVRDLGEQKQTRVTEFDQQLVESGMRQSHVADWSLLHPSRMYDVLNPYWWGHQSREWVSGHVRYAQLPAPPPAGIPDLPPRYVAVKFYFNDCFPATEHNRAFVDGVLRTLAARGPVVALSTGLNIDDHGGVRVVRGRRTGAHGEARDLRGDQAAPQAVAREASQQRSRLHEHHRQAAAPRVVVATAPAEAGARGRRSEEARRHVSRGVGGRARHRTRRLRIGSDCRRPVAVGSRLRGALLGAVCPMGAVAVPHPALAPGRRHARWRRRVGFRHHDQRR